MSALVEQLLSGKDDPMLCKPATKADVKSKRRLWETKLDGTRALAGMNANAVVIRGRPRDRQQGSLYTQRLPDLTKDLMKLPPWTVLDMEIVWRDAEGVIQFDGSQRRCATHVPSRILIEKYPVKGATFDVLVLSGRDMRGLPYLERKRLLKELLETSGVENLEYVPYYADGETLFEQAHEGVVGKIPESVYKMGIRSHDWIKVKYETDLIDTTGKPADIIGYTTGNGKRADWFGALILAQNGKYIGKAGPGFLTDNDSRKLTVLLKKCQRIPPIIRIDEPYVAINTDMKADVVFHRWTKDHVMRFPKLKHVLGCEQPQQVQEKQSTLNPQLFS